MGEGAVGKTSFRQRVLTGEFEDRYIGTIGINFGTHEMMLGDTFVKISLWDPAGQKAYTKARIRYSAGSAGGLVLFDVTRRETFTELYDKWITVFWESNERKVPLVIIGNKTDLVSERQVQASEAEAFAAALSEECDFTIPYIETSVKEDLNITKAVECLVRFILDQNQARETTD